METRTPLDVVAVVHVVGPVEPEPSGDERETHRVQRCLVCDALLHSVDYGDLRARRPYVVGSRLAISLIQSSGVRRYPVGDRGLRDGEVRCRPVPFLLL